MSRAVHLELTPNTTTQEFKMFKMFKTINSSDNGKCFQATAKWLKQIIKSEQLHGHLTKENINWKFNLSKAPWEDISNDK